MRSGGRIAVLILAVLLGGCQAGEEGPAREDGSAPDLVILEGRVIDPESGLDGIRNVGIADGTIVAVTEAPLEGRDTIRAGGLIVAPGFVDLHSHGADEENNRLQVRDGVTTALELELGTDDVEEWYRAREGRSLIHFGVSAGHVRIRMRVMEDPGEFLPTGPAAREEATGEEIEEMKELLSRNLRDGAVAVGFGIAYTAGASRREILEMFRVAAEHGAGAHVHIRYAGGVEPESSFAGLQEVLSLAAATGVPLHVVHLPSMALGDTPALLDLIREARERGVDVTTELYPYRAAMTRIESTVFDPGWEERLGIGPGDLEWPPTGERLTPDTFREYRERGGFVILHLIPPEAVAAVRADPDAIIASDGRIHEGRGHPRGAGTFARVLGEYVREEGHYTWSEALRRISLLPARRVEHRVPEMARKGRVQVGADADLAIFDPHRVRDRATFADPARPSEGIDHVLVAGVPVVRDGELREDRMPGRAIRAVGTSGGRHSTRLPAATLPANQSHTPRSPS